MRFLTAAAFKRNPIRNIMKDYCRFAPKTDVFNGQEEGKYNFIALTSALGTNNEDDDQ